MNEASTSPMEAGQYSLAKTLGIWTLAALPMALLSWIAFPLLWPDTKTDPLAAAVSRISLLTAGLVWLFILSMIIVRHEEGDLRWTTIKRRLWLNKPRVAKTGEFRWRLLLWAIPIVAATAVWELAITGYLDGLFVSVFPALAEPPGYSMAAVFEQPDILSNLKGAWWFLGLFVIQSIFNAMLGEEFLFRGILMPKLEGLFGKWSWLASGVLHGLYHLHQPWGILGNVVSCTLFFALPSWYFRSIWFGIIIHSAQSIYFAFLILGVVLGLA